jgi:glycosyltransferase involved in cell wall biosynthesis
VAQVNSERKILFFYPHNFTELSSGTHRRAIELLEYFRIRGVTVDIFSINGFTNRWDKKASEGNPLFRKLYTFDWHYSIGDTLKNYWRSKKKKLPDLALTAMCKQFRNVVAKETYSHVIISYVYWSKLIDYAGNTIKIVDLHDFCTLNQYMYSGVKDFKLGHTFQDEIQAISKFDYALSISETETLFLEPFCPYTEFVNAPVAFPERFQDDDTYKYDLLFVGSGDNPFNKDGIIWFIENVFPLLPPTLNVAVVGGVSSYLKEKPNLYLIQHIGSLDDIYFQSQVIICPLRGGTGLKVKLVEALSYGKPVVTTKWGFSGILQKDNNGCVLADTVKDFAKAINDLLTDKDYYQKVRAQGIEFFRKKFTRDVCWKNLDSIFNKE